MIMQIPKSMAKVLSILLTIVTLVLTPVLGLAEPVFFNTGEANRAVKEAAGGFMAGICHPDPDYKDIKKANIGWIRVDIPFAFDENGKQSASYRAFKKEMKGYVKRGIKVLGITPNPAKYLEQGLDIRKKEDISKIEQVARFYATDLQGIVSAFQIANEQGIDRFTKPFNLREAAKFIGLHLKEMYPLRGKILLSYNLCGDGVIQLPFLLAGYAHYVDFIGIDLYFGCFENFVKRIETFPGLMRLVHSVVRKPMLLAEFGYISCGEPKTEEEKREVLRQYGFESEEEARANIDAFIEKMPEPLREEFHEFYADETPEEKAKLVFNGEYSNHIFRELAEGTGLTGYPHTPEGQAKFYKDLIPMLKGMDFCVGAFIYQWRDSDRCYVCHQQDCPVETGWGLLNGRGEKKPAYYVVQKEFAAQ